MTKQQQKGRSKNNEADCTPDGGWGWMVVAGYVLSGAIMIPIVQNFGFIYMDRLHSLGMTSTDITLIISLNSSIGPILGIFQGFFFRKFGYRTMALLGVTLFTTGTFLTGMASSLPHYVITHGIITSAGFTYCINSFSLAFNSYFKKRRSFAQGILMGCQGLGPVVMPLMITWFLKTYDVQWTAFLLAALNANGYVGALLLQPVSRHKRVLQQPEEHCLITMDGHTIQPETPTASEETTMSIENTNNQQALSTPDDTRKQYPVIEVNDITINEVNHDENAGDVSPGERTRRYSPSSLQRFRKISSNDEFGQKDSLETVEEHDEDAMSGLSFYTALDVIQNSPPSKRSRCISAGEYTKDNVEDCNSLRNRKEFNSSGNIFRAASRSFSRHSKETINISTVDLHMITVDSEDAQNEKTQAISEKLNKERFGIKGLGRIIVQTFDLDLLKDPIYLTITFGLSIAIIGELVFSLLTAFIMEEVGLTRQETATFMAMIAASDIIARFTSPILAAKVLHIKSVQIMYLFALFCLIVTRTCLLFVSEYKIVLCVGVGIGFAKGIRTVFWAQVLPDYVEISRLGSAMAIQNLMNGALIFFAGPLGGKLVEISNSYLTIVYFANVLSGTTILLWMIPMIKHRYFAKKKASESSPQKSAAT